MPGGIKKQMVDTSIGLPTVEVGELNFASGAREKKIYLLGYESAVNLIMSYWDDGIDVDTAKKNVEFVKEMLFKNKTWTKGK